VVRRIKRRERREGKGVSVTTRQANKYANVIGANSQQLSIEGKA